MKYLSVSVAHQNKLVQHLAVWVVFWNNFPKDKKQFLDGVVFERHHEADDSHQNRLHFLAIQNHGDNSLQSHDFCPDISIFYEQTHV